MVENFVAFFTWVGFISGMNFLMDCEVFIFIERLPAFVTFVGLLGMCFLVHDEGRLLAEGLSTLTTVVAFMLGSFPTSAELSFPREKVPNSLIGLTKIFGAVHSLNNFDDDFDHPVCQVHRAFSTVSTELHCDLILYRMRLLLKSQGFLVARLYF